MNVCEVCCGYGRRRVRGGPWGEGWSAKSARWPVGETSIVVLSVT